MSILDHPVFVGLIATPDRSQAEIAADLAEDLGYPHLAEAMRMWCDGRIRIRKIRTRRFAILADVQPPGWTRPVDRIAWRYTAGKAFRTIVQLAVEADGMPYERTAPQP